MTDTVVYNLCVITNDEDSNGLKIFSNLLLEKLVSNNWLSRDINQMSTLIRITTLMKRFQSLYPDEKMGVRIMNRKLWRNRLLRYEVYGNHLKNRN